MEILITGGNGQLANEIKGIINTGKSDIGKINTNNINSIFYGSKELDISNHKQVNDVINRVKPDIVINCAAYTNVDGCETDPDKAFMVNSIGPRNLAIECEKIGAKLVHISTDYIFSGDSNKPQKEYDLANPKSIYGSTKLMGENYVREFSSKYFIIRTSWLYGEKGNNFVYTIINLAKTKKEIMVVNDQIGNPTNANDVAFHILKLINTEEYGIYNCTGEGECSWYDFAKRIVDLLGEDCIVNPCTTEEFPRPAKRPAYSSLDNMMLRCTVGNDMRQWKDAIDCFMKKYMKVEGNRK
ncbi:MAG: dTDP-4-dehydrorhamnose reductase [Clostridiales bacterium]|nr:dTDP-4-dehydrorhamnose reductase [Clostridiales bacterium]